jgi:serine/threonine protein kinase
VAHCLKILHDLRIVHGDLKPSNVLIKRTELGYTTKLIDFDSSYIGGRPRPAEEIVGTINCWSPDCSATSKMQRWLRRNSGWRLMCSPWV